jgi:hypothetical protein
MRLETPVPAGDSQLVAHFVLTNTGESAFDGCIGEEWGISLILETGRDAGHLELVDHSSCIRRFTLQAGEVLEWSREVPLKSITPGRAKLSGWLRVVEPGTCDQYGCDFASVSTAMETIEVGKQ